MWVRYRIVFETEYHIGDGFARPGMVDNSIIKDNKGRLYIPGHTMKGVVRDAAENFLAPWRAKLQICDGTFERDKRLCGIKKFNVNSPCLLCRLFGSAYIPGYFSFSPAVFEKEYREFIACDLGEEYISPREYLIPDQFRISTHNKIDRATGTAEKELLFSYELGANVVPFEGEIKRINSERKEEAELVILISALRFIRRFGARRRKGWGKCRVQITGPTDWEEKIDKLKELLENGEIGTNDRS